jgi:hypothetical protein
LAVVLALVACATPPKCPPPTSGDIVYVTGRDWHTEIGIPVNELDGKLASFAPLFPGAKTIMFGYGKKTFFTAPADDIGEYFLGPFPGPGVIQVFAINTTPDAAYSAEETVTLALPPGGKQALSDFIWNDLKKDDYDKTVEVAPSTNPAGTFYAAKSRYNLFHTCNRWAADALDAAHLPVAGDGVILSNQSMSRVREAAQQRCEP